MVERPTIFYMNNCKLMQQLYEEEFPPMEKQKVTVGKERAVYFAVKENFTFSYYEKILCDAVYSIWVLYRYLRDSVEKYEGRREMTFTVTDVLACMSGKDDIRIRKTKDGRPGKEERLIESLEKLGKADIGIWWEEERKERKLTGVSPVIAGKFLPIRRIDGTGKFRLNLDVGLPVYEYAAALHQMIRIPKLILSCEEWKNEKGEKIPALTLQNSDEILMLKHQIVQRLELLRNEKNRFTNRKIRYYYESHRKEGNVDGLFATMGIRKEQFASDSAWANKKQALDRQVHAMLDYYCNIGYLGNYVDAGIGKGRTRRAGVIGVDLEGVIKDPMNLIPEITEE